MRCLFLRASARLSCWLGALLLLLLLTDTLVAVADGRPGAASVSASADCSVEDCGEQVDVTAFLLRGDTDGARAASLVAGPEAERVGLRMPSHAAFATADPAPEAQNRLFWWFWPAQRPETEADAKAQAEAETEDGTPLLIWLQGGPGGSSLFGMFEENGPYYVKEDLSLRARLHSWNQRYHVVWIDNPVGAGYSYTASGEGYVTSSKQAADNLYNVLLQLYQVFPELKESPLYITGESFAGHYVPAIAYKIASENERLAADGKRPLPKLRRKDGDDLLARYAELTTPAHLPLAGVAIGDGWLDPISQINGYADLLWATGRVNPVQKAVFESYAARAVEKLNEGDTVGSFNVWDEMINGDFVEYPTYYFNTTADRNYENSLRTTGPAFESYYSTYVTQADVRSAIHAGNATFGSNSGKCEEALIPDIMVSYRPELESLLQSGYRVMIYSGDVDVIVGLPTTSQYVYYLDWPGADGFMHADRAIWRVQPSDTEVAGFVQEYDNLVWAVVRNAGHLVPTDQARRAFDMINRFVDGEPFPSILYPTSVPDATDISDA